MHKGVLTAGDHSSQRCEGPGLGCCSSRRELFVGQVPCSPPISPQSWLSKTGPAGRNPAQEDSGSTLRVPPRLSCSGMGPGEAGGKAAASGPDGSGWATGEHLLFSRAVSHQPGGGSGRPRRTPLVELSPRCAGPSLFLVQVGSPLFQELLLPRPSQEVISPLPGPLVL